MALRYGEVCKNCPGLAKCRDIPTAAEPLVMQCLSCDGTGCDECDHGTIDIACCPMLLVTEDVLEVMEYAELYEKGLPPVAGGALDQAKSFTDACRIIWQEIAYWKNRLGIIG